MSIIRKTKEVMQRPTKIEATLFRLRAATKDVGKGKWGLLAAEGGIPGYAKGKREDNALALRMLWEVYARADIFMRYLQYLYISQVRFNVSSVTEVLNADGERYEVFTALDHWRTYKPKALGNLLMFSPQTYHKRNFSTIAGDHEANAALIQEYCETIAQDKNPSVVLSIHNPDLLAKFHGTRLPDSRWSMLSVNVDKKYTWTQRERPIYLRRGLTVKEQDMTRDKALQRFNLLQDHLRILGEGIDSIGCAYDRPALNIVMAAMVEVSNILNRVIHELIKMNEGIMREVSEYRGFQYVGKNVLIEEAKSMRYAPGVTVTNAVSPVFAKQIGSLTTPVIRELIKRGAMNADVPNIAFRMECRFRPLAMTPNYGPLWQRGRSALRKSIDPVITALLKKEAAVIGE